MWDSIKPWGAVRRQQTWVATAVTVASAAYGAYSSNKQATAAKKRLGDLNYPDYSVDPNFQGGQDYLRKYSEDILAGNIPKYYEGIGQTMPEGTMKDYVYSMGGDMQQRELAQQALSGRARTGMSNNTIATVGNLSAQSRMADYLRSIEGKQWLMNTGLQGEQNVINAGAWNMSQQNPFNQADYASQVDKVGMLNANDAQRQAANRKAVSTAASAIGGAFGGGGGVSSIGGYTGGINSGNMAQYLNTGTNAQTKSGVGSSFSPVVSQDVATTQLKNGGTTDKLAMLYKLMYG